MAEMNKIRDDVKKLVNDIDNVQHSMECTLGECEYANKCDELGACYVACVMVHRFVIEKIGVLCRMDASKREEWKDE